MKKVCFLFMIMFILISFSCVYGADFNIVISPQKVFIDGIEKNFEVYNIDGNNFFKLRDIAYVLNGTASQFSVGYNAEKALIEVQKDKSYVPVGGELNISSDKSSTAIKSLQKLNIDSVSKELNAYNIGGNNFFKLRDLGKELNFEVDFNNQTNSVIIESHKAEKIANLTNVVAKIFDGVMYVEITSDLPITPNAPFYLSEPNRLILDIPNSKFSVDSKSISVNYGNLTSVRLGDQGNNLNRVVLDINEQTDYKIIQSDDKTKTCLIFSKALNYNDLIAMSDKVLLVYNGSIISIPDDEKEKNDDNISSGEVNDSGEIANPKDDYKVELTEEQLNNRVKISSIKYSSSTNKLKITGNKSFDYDTSELTNPHRIIVDIKNAVLEVEGPTSITPNNNNVSEIRFSQKDIDVVRVVFELKSENSYSVVEKGKTIEVRLDEVIPGNLQYEQKGNTATLTLYDVSKSVFSVSESSSKNTYTLKFSSSKFTPKEETIKTDDDITKKINVTETKIIITGNGKTKFSMKQVNDDVIITMKSSSSTNDEEFIVLLDAGHGGTEPGACNGDDCEKTFNLAILLKLKEMLEDNGYTVYVTRDEDVKVSVDDRVELATKKHPDADLYISIHNNSLNDKKYSGTLVMYCDRDTSKYNITNKELASYVLEELVDNLGTIKRGFIKVEQSDTSKRVLTELPMPSILCEVAFVSNDEEVARLRTEEFQEAAALGIYNGIVAAQKQMKD